MSENTSSDAPEQIDVQVCYALPDKQVVLDVKVAPGTAAVDVVRASGVERHFPDLDLDKVKLGVFGKAVKPAYTPEAGERIEIYRPLLADPKDSRKKRADRAKAKRDD
jgi:putative ubiquitin-RnfH superfamily antitoxin RatB of RatAB toxin-antitoxin module